MDSNAKGAHGNDVAPPPVAVFRTGRQLDLVRGGGEATAIVWPGVGSRQRSVHRIRLDAGAATVTQRHPGEAVYLVVDGSGRITSSTAAAATVVRRSAIYVPAGCDYVFEAETELTLVGGPCPPDLALYGGSNDDSPPDPAGPPQVFAAETDGLPMPLIAKGARLIIYPGMGARFATLAFVWLEAGEENQPHAHAEADDTIVILEGEGSADNLTAGTTLSFAGGDVVFVGAGTRHRIKADRGVPVISVGGPCPADLAVLRAQAPPA